jgi:CRISP-associated protein Cas1
MSGFSERSATTIRKPAFALDLIEPERPRVDAALLAFIQSRSFSGSDFVLRPDGVCCLSPQLARSVASLIV